MILFNMLKDSDPAMAKEVETRASLIDGDYHISQTKSRRQNIIDFFALLRLYNLLPNASLSDFNCVI